MKAHICKALSLITIQLAILLGFANPTHEASEVKTKSFQGTCKENDDVQSAKRLVEARPKDANLRYLLGQAYNQSGCFEEAINSFKEAIALDPKSAVAMAGAIHDIGYTYAVQRKYREAAEAFKLAITADPKYYSAYRNLGNTYDHLGQVKEAIKILKQGINIQPRDAYSHAELSYAYTLIGQMRNAMKAAKRVTQLEPTNAYAFAQLSEIYIKLKKKTAAVKLARKAISLSSVPNDNVALSNAAELLIELGKYDEAIVASKRSISLDPTLADAYFNLAHAYILIDRYGDAVASYEQGFKLAPSYTGTYLDRGWGYLYLERGAEAAADARAYIETEGWKDRHAPYAAFMAHFGYRQAKRDDEAHKIVAEAAAHIDSSSWPYKILRYLRHEITAQELIDLATNNDKQTEARAYIGMNLLLAGHRDEAYVYLEWVRKNGNKSFVEYALAITEINRLNEPSNN
jgi:tetratricopeptide (TPR) repeat protein